MKFLCDVMLGRLARWLRAAGYDTTLAVGDAPDRALLQTATAEDRIFLTLDREILEHKAANGRALVLGSEAPSEQARELKHAVGVDWLHNPFTRCVVDNTPLHKADDAARATLPPRVRDRGGTITECPTCGRLYWPGDHHTRMRARLEAWNRL